MFWGEDNYHRIRGNPMKKLCVIIFLLLGLICRVSAGEGKTDTLTKMENAVLGVDYSNQKIDQRLIRLEEYVYGRKNTGTAAERIKRLAKDLNADVIGQETVPDENMAAEQIDEEYADSSVDYPVLDDVEKKLSIKSTPNQSLHSRIAAIEKNMFNKVYETDDFYTRVERIKDKAYTGSELIADDEGISIPEVSTDEFNMQNILPRKRNYQNGSTTNSDNKLALLEQKVLNNTFPDENNNDRLARLESYVFDTEFYYDNEHDRLERLESALKAQRTADKYDNNRFQQKLNTALQIGAMVLMVLAFIL